MSAIYFHTPNGEARLSGSERAFMGHVCNEMGLSVFPGFWETRDRSHPLRNFLPPDCYLLKKPRPWNENDVKIYLQNGWRSRVIYDGKTTDAWEMNLNTAMAIGGEAVQLMARLHGQCEVHCYVLGKNRMWLADIMERGHNSALFRRGMGWLEVIELLRSGWRDPVVCSYSVCDRFPSRTMVDMEDDFYDLTEKEQWDLCMPRLVDGDGLLEMKPDGWSDYRFGDEVSMLDLSARMSALP